MKTNKELAEEYLATAGIIQARILAIKRTPGPDYTGSRAQRIALLTEMYEECRMVGHLLGRRENTV